MSSISEKIEACYKAAGKDRVHFAQEVGLAESTIRNWGRYGSMPAADILYKIAKYFDLPMEYFMDKEETAISDKEIAMIIKMRKLTDEQLNMLSYMIEKFENENSLKK